MNVPLEKQMIKRLKILGLLLLCFSLISVAYTVTLLDKKTEENNLFEASIDIELEEAPPLNPWFISICFAVVGAGCLLIVRKKKRLKENDPSLSKKP